MGGKRIPPQANDVEDRYRLLISDGKIQHSFTMLATQLNYMFTDNILADYTIMRVDNYITSMIGAPGHARKVLVLLDITVLHPGAEVGRKIGNPIPLDQAIGSKSSNTSTDTGMSNADNTFNDERSKKNYKGQVDHISEGHVHPINSLSPYQNK